MNEKIKLEGIIVDGVIYAVALAPNNDISPCEYCDLRDKYSLFFTEDEDFEGNLDLGDLCRRHLSDNQMFVSRKEIGRNQKRKRKIRMCLKDKSKRCTLCHDCDIDISNPRY